MGLILCLETATKVCSVSLSKDGTELHSITHYAEKFSHAEKLNTSIVDLFAATDYELNDLDAVAVSEGPGSYTGLRIGTSTAKGFCYALDLPLIAINSLKALAQLKRPSESLICPMFDARRMEVYSAVFNAQLETLEETRAVVVESNSYDSFLDQYKVCFLGPGAAKCQEIIQHENAIFDLETKVSANGMNVLAEEKWQQNDIVDLAYFEPFYLKDFIAGKPKKIF